MLLHVEVLEGQDLLRAPQERCRPMNEDDGDGEVGGGGSSLSSRRKGRGKRGAIDTVRRFATKIKSPLSGSADKKKLDFGNTQVPTLGSGKSSSHLVQLGKPFVWLKLKDIEQRTSIGEDTYSCKWNESFVFDVRGLWKQRDTLTHGEEEEEDNGLELEIQVRDSVKCLNYGQVKIPLGRLSSSTKIKQWYQLVRPEWDEKQFEEGFGSMSTIGSGVDSYEDEDVETCITPTNNSVPSSATASGEDSCGVLYLSLHFEEDPMVEDDEDLPHQKGSSRSLASLRDRSMTPTNMQILPKPRTIPCRLVDYIVMARLRGHDQEPELVERFPERNHEDIELPVKIEWFIFAFETSSGKPITSIMEEHEIIEGIPVSFFAFVHAPRGVPLYGYCLMYRDEENGCLSCITMVSRLQCGDVFRECLFQYFQQMIQQTGKGTEEEEEKERAFRMKIGQRLVYEIPMPLPGLMSVKFDLVPNSNPTAKTLEFQLGQLGDCPNLTFSDGLDFLIRKLGPGLLIELWVALLLEYKVVMHSKKQWMLSVVGETLLTLLYPFKWRHTYVSILPSQLLECVQAPLPYIVGIHSELVKEIPDIDLAEVLLLDLDRGVVRKGSTLHVEALPVTEMRRLSRMLNAVLGLNPCAFDDPTGSCDWSSLTGPEHSPTLTMEQSRDIQLCFLECICELLQGYRECLFFLNESMPVFNTPKFLERRAQDIMFFSRFLETQAFEHFKEVQTSKSLTLFRAYFLRVRIRERDRDQYLALNSQKRYIRERKQAALMDPDDEDFDSRTRNRKSQNQTQQQQLKRMESRNDTVWSARERRRFVENVPGLTPYPIEEKDLETADAKQPTTQQITFDANMFDMNGVDSLELHRLSSILDVEYDLLRTGLRDLRAIVGSHHFQDGMEAMEEMYSDEDSYSSGEDQDDGVEEDETVVSAASPLNLSVSTIGKQRGSIMAPPRPRRKSSIARSIATYDAEYTQNARSVRDRKVELALQECITKIFLNKPVDEEQQEACGDQFVTSTHARDLFVLILYQPHHRSNHSYGGNKGRGLREGAFNSLVFLCKALLDACARKEDYGNARQMLELSQSYFLDRSSTKYDLPSPSGRPQANSFFSAASNHHQYQQQHGSKLSYLEQRRKSINFETRQATVPVTPEDYLEYHLRGMAIWQSLLFWEDAFDDILTLESRKRARTLSTVNRGDLLDAGGGSADDTKLSGDHHVDGGTDSSMPPPLLTQKQFSNSSRHLRRMTTPPSETSAQLAKLSAALSSTPEENQLSLKKTTSTSSTVTNDDEFQDVLFELATSMVYQMVRVGASQDKAKALVSRIVTQHGLNEEHEDTLGTLITNISKAVHVTNM